MRNKIYDRIFDVLSNDATLISYVSATNIKPNYDQIENEKGNAITYGFVDYTLRNKNRRSSGIIELQIAATDKLTLSNVLQRVIALLTPKNLTGDRSKITVAKFQTTGGTNDSNIDQFNRNVAVVNFDFRLIEKA